MTFNVVLRCGCTVKADTQDKYDAPPPFCDTHGPQVAVRVNAPAPRFRGACLGPCATFDPTLGAK